MAILVFLNGVVWALATSSACLNRCSAGRRASSCQTAKGKWPDSRGTPAMCALIVDDEALARSKLLHMLRSFPDVEVVAEASGGAAALMLAAQLLPDVIFLDVQMPEIDGFDVAASLPDDAPALYSVTAFDRMRCVHSMPTRSTTC